MRCNRCQFENMPGLNSCVQCGSVLTAGGEKIETEPPRMSNWKVPLRMLMRSIRGMGVPAFDVPDAKMPRWAKLFVSVGMFGVALSIIPGLGHALLGIFRKVVWWVVAWAVMLGLSIFLYGSSFGNMLLGIAFGLHVWIAMTCSLNKEIEEFLKRLIAFLVIAFFYLFFYRTAAVFMFQDITGAQSTMDAPYHNIETGDFLLARYSLATEPFERSEMGIVALDTVGRHEPWREFFRIPRGRSFAQVIGLAGEKVEIKEKTFYINDKELDKDQYPVPRWIGNHELETIVPDSCYFMIAEYNGTGYNAGQIINVCTIQSNRIEAKVFMRWHPLSKRGFIRESE